MFWLFFLLCIYAFLKSRHIYGIKLFMFVYLFCTEYNKSAFFLFLSSRVYFRFAQNEKNWTKFCFLAFQAWASSAFHSNHLLKINAKWSHTGKRLMLERDRRLWTKNLFRGIWGYKVFVNILFYLNLKRSNFLNFYLILF